MKEAMMGRKVACATALLGVAVMSVVLVGGQIGGGFLWWGNHEPIYIYGDADFTYRNGVMSGSGTAEDPYVIEGWRIDDPDADYGIYIDHTTAHFVIRDCVIERSRQAGIYFNTVRNGRVVDSQIGLSDTAVHLLASSGNQFVGNVVAECKVGLVMGAHSQDNLVAGNSFIDNGLNAYDPQRRNRWFDESGGNYWSDYLGVDADQNGIGDVPYYPLWDQYPLISPPVEWTGVETAGLSYSGNWVAPDGSLVVTSQTPIALVSADPGAGVQEIRYAIDNGEWVSYTGPIYLTGPDGPRKVSYFGIDKLGNHEMKRSVSFVLDNHPPQTAIGFGEPQYIDERGTWVTSKTPISLTLIDHSTYGVTKTFYRIDGGAWQAYTRPFVLYVSDGPHQISYYSRNASGVTEALKTVIVLKDDAPPNTRGEQPSTVVPVIGAPTTQAGDVQDEDAGDASASSAVPSDVATTPVQTPTAVPPVEETDEATEAPVVEPVVEPEPEPVEAATAEPTSPVAVESVPLETAVVETASGDAIQTPSETVPATEPQTSSDTSEF
jgi:hypothetical protein